MATTAEAAAGARAARAGSSRASLAAFVLHSYDWSESSLILDVFSRAQGRMVVLAKGAKRPYSQLRAVLLPLKRVQLTLTQRRTDADGIHVLRAAEWVRPGLVSRPGAVLTGLYLNELLMKLLPRGEPHARLFDIYEHTLDVLLHGEDAAAALRAFELFLLHEQGVLPELHLVTTTREPLRTEGEYVLDAQSGLSVAGRGVPGAVWMALHEGLAADDLGRVRQVCALVPLELKSQLRQVLSHHLGHQPLHTRQLLLDVQNA
ncbi:MAG: DNA repair protein RecO [Rhizobacter sp.]